MYPRDRRLDGRGSGSVTLLAIKSKYWVIIVNERQGILKGSAPQGWRGDPTSTDEVVFSVDWQIRAESILVQ